MDNNQTPEMMPQGQQQQGPRPPNLDPQVFAMLNELDGYLAKTPMTRVESAQCGQTVQNLVRRLESDKITLERMSARAAELEAEVKRLRDSIEATKVVGEVLKGAK